MNAKEIRDQAIEVAREPFIRQIEDLLTYAKDNNSNVSSGKLSVEWKIPSNFPIILEQKDKEVKDGDNVTKVNEEIITCESLNWLRELFQKRGYSTSYKAYGGYVYGQTYYLIVDTQ